MSKFKRYKMYIFLVGLLSIFLFFPTKTSAASESVPVTETIYWGITNHVLTLSDTEVEGTLKNSFSSRSTITTSATSWLSHENEIQAIEKVVVQSSISPVDMSYWFKGFTNCTSFDLAKLDTSNTTNMSNLFSDCENIATIDIHHFDTTNVTNMQFMFYGCSKLTAVDLQGFHTSNVTTMDSMFYRCSALESVNLANFDTSNVTNMRFMFYGCTSFLELDLSNLQIHSDAILNGMLRNLSSLKKISLSESIIPFLSKTGLAYNWYTETLVEYTNTNPIPAAGTYYKTCKITFHGNDTNVVGTKTCLYNTTTDASGIEVPKNAGYLFNQWVTTRNGNVAFDFSVPITKDVNIYAGFVLCPHEYGEWTITKEAACDEAGSRHRVCNKCGYDDVEEIAKLNHVLGPLIPKKEADCTTDGVEEHYYCSVCKKNYDASLNYLPTVIIKALGHQYSDTIKWMWNDAGTEATARFTCTVCNHIEVVPAEVTEELLNAATCISSGAKRITATVTLDGETYTQSYVEALPMVDHVYGTWILRQEPNCVEEGWIPHYRCSVCLKDFDEQYQEISAILPALGHDYKEEWTIDVEASCEVEGSKSHHCTRCDSKDSITLLPPIGHAYGEWSVATAATCLENGVEQRVCAHDENHKETRELPALGHDYPTEWIISKYPTCTENGIKERVCTHDETHKQIEILTPVGHQFSTDLKFDEQGHFYSCSNCQEHKDQEEHHYGEWEVQREATEYSDGLEVRHCDVCGYGETHILPKLKQKGFPLGAIIGIVIGSVVFVMFVIYCIGYFCLYKKKKLHGKFFDGIYLPMRKIFKE